MSTQLVKLTSSQMRIGVEMPFDVRDIEGNLMLAQGQAIVDMEQLQALQARGAYAEKEAIQIAAALAAKAAGTTASRVQTEEQPRRKPTLIEMWDQTVFRLDRLLRGIASEPGFAARAEEFAGQFIALVNRDPDIGIHLSVRQDERRMSVYGLTHSLHTALVCALMSGRMGWPPERCLSLVKAALTMNVATFELQGRLAATGAKASDAQREQIRAHPEAGWEMLRAAGVADEDWLSAVRCHHECADGSGYPRGLKDDIPELACALRLADVFMAKISPRPNRPSMPVQDAARQMFQASQGSPMAAAVIKEYGVYPPGDLVQLVSGEKAIVLRRGAAANAPVVAAFTDRSGMPMATTTRRDTSLPAFAVSGPLRDKKAAPAVALDRLYGITSG